MDQLDIESRHRIAFILIDIGVSGPKHPSLKSCSQSCVGGRGDFGRSSQYFLYGIVAAQNGSKAGVPLWFFELTLVPRWLTPEPRPGSASSRQPWPLLRVERGTRQDAAS